MTSRSQLKLEDGARVAVVGGGPAGSFFSAFFLQMAQRLGRDVAVDLYEPRDYTCPGPRGCNMCGGIVSESLMQNLATEGIQLPSKVIQRRIDSYFLHMDVGSVRIATPMQEMRIAAVARGAGPRGADEAQDSFDNFLLDLAVQRGARHVQERVSAISIEDALPRVTTKQGDGASYDLVVSAVGVNSSLLKVFEELSPYRRPAVTKAWVGEFSLGAELIERYMGNSMHVFLLNLPRLEFAALIPKSDFVTVCLLGEQIDKTLVDAFLDSNEVKQVLPPHWKTPKDFCHCSPKMNVDTAFQPFADRLVFVGDCGTTRLFKDGIGAAYRTAKAAAKTALFRGIAAEDFRRGFWPTCRSIHADNRLGKAVFKITEQVQKHLTARQALWRMTSREQKLRGNKRRMSMVLWDTFTGSAPYRSVMWRGMHPGVVGRLAWELAAARRSGGAIKPKEQVPLASGTTGLSGMRCAAGHVIYRQGEPADGMYVIEGGKVELVRDEGEHEFRLGVLDDGDFFGEMALFGRATRPATARIVEDSTIVTLERHGLLRRIHEDPSMAFRLIEHLAHRIAELEASLIRGGAPLTRAGWEAAAIGEERSAEPVALATGTAGIMGKEYAEGDVIYHQGDRGDCMYVIQGGKAEGVRREGEREYTLGVLSNGDFFGELALFDEETRPATVRALEGLHVFTLERNGLLRRVHEDPSSAFQLIENMAQRINRLEHHLILHAQPVTAPVVTAPVVTAPVVTAPVVTARPAQPERGAAQR